MVSAGLFAREWIRSCSGDLTAVFAFTVMSTAVVLVPGMHDSPLGVIVGLPLLLFAPGYALVSMLFPQDAGTDAERAPPEDTQNPLRATPPGIGLFERLALGFGASVALLPLFGLALDLVWEIELLPALVLVDGFVVGCLLLATYRRYLRHESVRFSVPFGAVVDAARGVLFPGPRIDTVVNVVLVVSVLLAVGTVTFAVASPQRGEQFTEFYLLGEDGAFAGGNNSTAFVAGEERPLTVGIESYEGQPVTYTVVVELQRVGDGARVRQSWSLDRFQVRLDSGESERVERAVTPLRTGEQFRLTYLLYRQPPPEDPTIDNAYRHTYLWIDVEEE